MRSALSTALILATVIAAALPSDAPARDRTHAAGQIAARETSESTPAQAASNNEFTTASGGGNPPASATTGGATAAVPLHVPPQLAVPRPKREGPPSLFDDGQPGVQAQSAFLDVRINTPHRKGAQDVFNIYPYPVKPPTAQRALPLADSAKLVRGLLLSSGYTNRGNPDKAYQTGGWRWQYCFKAAVAKSGLGVPHTIFSEYRWADDITPYVCAETRKWNAFEEDRWNRYQKAIKDFEKNHSDAEGESVRLGLSPGPVARRGYGWAQQNILPGSWWMTCTRKVPGLTYYWQVPLTAAPSEKINIVLNELNALVIEGGW